MLSFARYCIHFAIANLHSADPSLVIPKKHYHGPIQNCGISFARTWKCNSRASATHRYIMYLNHHGIFYAHRQDNVACDSTNQLLYLQVPQLIFEFISIICKIDNSSWNVLQNFLHSHVSIILMLISLAVKQWGTYTSHIWCDKHTGCL